MMMGDYMNPSLSIVIPAYNAGQYIEDTIKSILSQSCKDFEIIVINDGSTDNTLEIVEKIKEVHKCIRLETIDNQGASHVRNLGIEIANGTYIAFVDSDDLLCKGAYDHEVNNILKQGKWDFIGGQYIKCDSDLKYGKLGINVPGKYVNNGKFNWIDIWQPHQTCMIKRDVINKISFPESCRFHEDTVFKRMLMERAGNALVIDRIWYILRINNESITHRIDIDETVIGIIEGYLYGRMHSDNQNYIREYDYLIIIWCLYYVKIHLDPFGKKYNKLLDELFKINPSIKKIYNDKDLIKRYPDLEKQLTKIMKYPIIQYIDSRINSRKRLIRQYLRKVNMFRKLNDYFILGMRKDMFDYI